MNLFESTLSDALHDEAREIAMSADLNQGREILDSRLDDVDRGRRRWTILGSAAVAATVAGVVAVVALGRPVAAPTPGGPTPTATRTAPTTFESTTFTFPFTVRPPAWVGEALDEPTSENARHVTWNRCEGSTCIGLSFLSLSVLNPFGLHQRDDTAMPSYRDYVDYLDSLAAQKKAVITDRASRMVGGRQATVLTIAPTTEIPEGVGCEAGDGSSDDCWDFFEGVATRMAVVDVGSSNPLVILTRTPPDNADGPAWTAQFDPMLDTVQLDLSQVNPMLGVWTRTSSREDVPALLADAGLSSWTERVLSELAPAGDPMRWELWVDPTWYRLYAVAPDGTRVRFDEHTYQRDGSRVVGTTADGSQLATTSTVTRDGSSLTWEIDAVDTNPDPTAVSEEAMTRVLYASSAWVRSTT